MDMKNRYIRIFMFNRGKKDTCLFVAKSSVLAVKRNRGTTPRGTRTAVDDPMGDRNSCF